ncbi:Gypsy retrotransposon integrase-like protein 1 [Senna tora]|uniref:Gypsy retrotransposon integrase-like protein 1 n=1 Tax=Senna tora TaxID=362788 RepID=A0A834TQY6_9FABA|nr:Gypsy retrotransposon integrase-like protein 1 [Senna tora]
MRCVPEVDMEVLMKEVHQGVCGEHQGARKLYEELMRLGYYWPTMEADTLRFVRQCMPCQKLADSIHAPAVELHALSTPWPFHFWAFDLRCKGITFHYLGALEGKEGSHGVLPRRSSRSPRPWEKWKELPGASFEVASIDISGFRYSQDSSGLSRLRPTTLITD